MISQNSPTRATWRGESEIRNPKTLLTLRQNICYNTSSWLYYGISTDNHKAQFPQYFPNYGPFSLQNPALSYRCTHKLCSWSPRLKILLPRHCLLSSSLGVMEIEKRGIKNVIQDTHQDVQMGFYFKGDRRTFILRFASILRAECYGVGVLCKIFTFLTSGEPFYCNFVEFAILWCCSKVVVTLLW